jgi:prophage antirepressor-like protein
MSIVQVFGNSEIRFVDHPEGKFEFGIVAADMAATLDVQNTHQLPVDDEWKGVCSITTPGGIQSMTVIWEPGIYQLLAKSRKPQAKPFQKWLFEEVLPSIRKTGQYVIAQPTQPRLPQRDAIAYIEAAKEVETINNLSLQQLLRDELIDELSAKRGQKQLAGDPVQYTIVKVRARELGYSTADIGNGSALGKFVAKAIAPAFIERVGKYEVKHYQVNDALDTAIKTYFGMKHSLAS